MLLDVAKGHHSQLLATEQSLPPDLPAVVEVHALAGLAAEEALVEHLLEEARIGPAHPRPQRSAEELRHVVRHVQTDLRGRRVERSGSECGLGSRAEIDDVKRLNDIGVYGVIIGKALFEQKITLEDLDTFAATAK